MPSGFIFGSIFGDIRRRLFGSAGTVTPPTPGPTFAYQAETNTLAASFATAPTRRRKESMDWAIRTLKAAGAWDKIIGLWKVGADQDASLKNWKSPGAGTDLVAVGAPTFVANTSFTGAAGKYLRTGVYLDQLSPTGVYMGFFGGGTAQGSNDMGAVNSAGNGLSLTSRNSTDQMTSRVLSAPSTTVGSATVFVSGSGWHGIGRNDAANVTPYKGPVPYPATALAGAAITDHVEIYACGTNNNGTQNASTRAQSGWVIAQGLTDAQAKVVANVMQELQDRFVEGEHDAYLTTQAAPATTYDAIVYGSTSMGLFCAYELKRQGKNVAVLGGWRDNPNNFGAMSATGLGQIDANSHSAYGGLALYMIKRAQALNGGAATTWPADPRRFRRALRELFDPSKTGGLDIPVIYSTGLSSVAKTGKRVTSVTTVDGRTLNASYFVDASFEGDLMKLAGLSTRIGREAAGSSKEALNGFRGLSSSPNHQFKNHAGTLVNISPYVDGSTAASGLLPGIAGTLGVDSPAVGAADVRSQAFNFRLTVTNLPQWRVPFPNSPPSGYDKTRYEPLGRLFAADSTVTVGDIFILNYLETSTTSGFIDLNAKGGWSTDPWGFSTGYTQSNYADRETNWKRHFNFILGLFYYLQYENDSRVPAALRTSALNLGLSMLHHTAPVAQDDYNWNPSLYVREGYRLESDMVIDANYMAQTDGTTPSSIKTVTTASYQFDSHGTSAWADTSTSPARIWIEGGFEDTAAGGTDNIQPLPYEAFIPKASECENLAVIFGASFTHAAFGSYRMELSNIQAGQSMAFAIAQALNNGSQALQAVDYPTLRASLLNYTPTLTGEVAPVLPQVN